MLITDIDFKKLKLPVQPQAMTAIMQLDDHTDLNFKELDQLIRVDQTISASILKMANSSFYSRGNKITSLQNAISLLGFKLIRSMVVLLTAKSMFEAGKYEKFRIYVHKHSIVVAIVAKALAARIGMQQIQEEAFVAGLLHDIGKVIMNVLDRQKFIETLRLALDDKVPVMEAEHRVFGYDHSQVGKVAAEVWKLPELFINIISNHENQTVSIPESETGRIELIVQYADFVAKISGYGISDQHTLVRGAEIATALGLSPEIRDHFETNQKEKIEADPFFKYCTGLMS